MCFKFKCRVLERVDDAARAMRGPATILPAAMAPRKNLHFQVVSIALLFLFGWYLTSRSKPSIRTTWSDQNMFADEATATEFRTCCTGAWQDLIDEWQQRQLLAIQGDATVPLVVYRCRDICGGLGDRQRGILTSFLLAVVTARAFLIDNETPVPMRHYFRMANPDLHWVFDESFMTNRSVLEESFMDTYPPIGDYSVANLSYYDAYDVVVQQNNFWKPLNIFQNPSVRRKLQRQLYDEHTLAGCMLNYLLVPEKHLLSRVQHTIQVEAERGRRILAVQIRSGDNQAKNETLIGDLAAIFMKCIEQVQSSCDTKFTVFLTTDSDQVAARCISTFPDLLTFPGPILHLDGFFGASDSPDTAFQKVLLDHIMLSSAAELIISRSGFAEFASLRGFKPYRHPQMCDTAVHYKFPERLPAGVPAGQLTTIADILQPSFEGRQQLL